MIPVYKVVQPHKTKIATICHLNDCDFYFVLEAGLTILKFRTFNKTATLLIIKQLPVLNYNANIIEYKEKKKKFQ